MTTNQNKKKGLVPTEDKPLWKRSALWAAIGTVSAGLAALIFNVDAESLAPQITAAATAIASIVSTFIAGKVD